MAQHDMNISNQSFPDFRTDLNNALSAINSMHSGTSRPSGAVAGTMWLDTTSASSPTIKFFDGSDDISFATIDYSANTINFLDSTVSADLLSDTTPQLGGNLDTNSHNIAFDDAHGINDENGNEQIIFQTTSSAVNQLDITNASTGNAPEISATGGDTNIDLKLTPKGSGKLNLDGIKFPNADGSANQVLQTDGAGNLSFASAGGGIEWQSTIVTGATHTATAGQGIWIDTTSNACTLTLPSSPSVGDELIFSDFARTWQNNAVTLNLNGSKFQGNTTPVPVYDTQRETVHIVYSGSTQGWIPINDGAVALETPQTYNADFLCIAGGGGGGHDTGGGGGAGGYRNSFSSESSGGGGSSETELSLSPSSVYTITIGGGGAGGTPSGDEGSTGDNSSIAGAGITTITSNGGGFGSRDPVVGGDGGSGGGGGSSRAGGNGTANQGFNGASGPGPGAGGGGGAGQVGNPNGTGGDGVSSSIDASATTRGGGGAGGGPTGRPGGSGGGGGATHPTGSGVAGTANKGGGGGGGAFSSPRNGGAGGSGIVILRVPTANYPGTTSGSPTVTTSGSDTIIKFTGSGTYTA